MAINHTVYEETCNGANFRIIETKAKFIRPVVINKPLSQVNYLGINGGFFSPISPLYDRPSEAEDAEYPDECCGNCISWYRYYTKNYEYNGVTRFETENRAALLIGTYTETNKTFASVVQARDVATAIGQYRNFPIRIDAVIGGGNLSPRTVDDSIWKSSYFDAENWTKLYESWGDFSILWDNIPGKNLRRTGIGLKKIDDEWYAYLTVSTESASMYDLRHLFQNMNCDHAIFLDGSGSSCMRWKDENNTTHLDENLDRYIWNMIMLTNVN